MLLLIDNFSTTCLLCFLFYNKIVVYYKTLRPKSLEKQLPCLALLLIMEPWLWCYHLYSVGVGRYFPKPSKWIQRRPIDWGLEACLIYLLVIWDFR